MQTVMVPGLPPEMDAVAFYARMPSLMPRITQDNIAVRKILITLFCLQFKLSARCDTSKHCWPAFFKHTQASQRCNAIIHCFHVRRHFARLSSAAVCHTATEITHYWQECSTSTVIPPASASNVALPCQSPFCHTATELTHYWQECSTSTAIPPGTL
jgi:hypothetical protein